MGDLPYNAEYAKSGRASCKGCKQNIPKDTLRVGIMMQSPHFDGKIPLWHHAKCFFVKKNSGNVEDVANFDNLRFEDQKLLRDGMSAGGSKGGKSKKITSEFSVEYAKTSRASCKLCGEKLPKTEIRISKLVTDTPEAHRYGPAPGWHHVDCFVKARVDLNFTDAADKLPGFKSLLEDDRNMLLDKIPPLGVKRKREEQPAVESKKMTTEEKLLKKQSDKLFNMRDKIQNNLSKKEMIQLLEYNDQHVSSGEQHLRDHLADCMVFGAIEKCPECKTDAPRFSIDAYRCNGNLTEWTKCLFVTKSPKRRPFVIPSELKEEHDFLNDYKCVIQERIFPQKNSAASKEKLPLTGCIIHLFGKFNSTKANMENKITELGGTVASKITTFVLCCISTETEVAKSGKKVISARHQNVHIVSPKFLEDVKNGSDVVSAIQNNLLCDWGGDPALKINAKEKMMAQKAARSMVSDVCKSSTVKVSVKGGVAVDPQSGLESSCHVYQTKQNIYNVVLGVVDLSRDMNKYYKLQILERDSGRQYYLFRSWGRVGTSIGNMKVENFSDPKVAISEFERLYFEKTSNKWSDRNNFVKKPGCLYPLDIDYGQGLDNLKELKPGDNSKLPKQVQDLICLIFDVELMKKAMVEFEIDLKKLPLGKLSKKQIEKAYSVLNEVQQVLSSDKSAVKILDASNRFYTLIPHDFGMNKPPLLDNEELIKSKVEMLESLLEIELAYKLLQGEEGSQSFKDPVDEHYDKLKTDIEVLDKKAEEFKIINKYLSNTHAATHNQYKLDLKRVFKINRHGESERYQKFKDMHNKKLLWHGSRLTNYVGILSQGLRIAPPEAPSTGYMFGKGIYFADMVSKSANYCFTTRNNPTGLLLLCEVALGNMYERNTADYITKLPKDKHSTKGCGKTIPDPKETTLIGDIEVPYGKPVQTSISQSQLLYNEYIVYDINQVNIKYLLEVDFIHRY